MTKTSTKKPARKTLSLGFKKTAGFKKPVQTPIEPATAAPVEPEPAIAPASAPVNEPVALAPAVAEQKPAPKTPKAKAAPKPAAPKPARVGKCTTIYAAALKRPQLTGKAFADMLIAEGLQSSVDTILTIRSDVVRVMNFLDEQGLLKSPFKQA